jgi:hypothetical protein
LTAETCKKLYLQQLDGSHAKFSHLEAILIQSMNRKSNPQLQINMVLIDVISPIRIKKSPISQLRKIKARLTLQPATENSNERKTKQRTKDQETKTEKDLKTKLKTKAV